MESHPASRLFYIGDIAVDPCVVLAPMEDVTNLPFRILCKRIGNPGLVVSEFVSAMAAKFNPVRTIQKMTVADEERPVAIQIFGGEPETMAKAAELAVIQGADIIDINMGCWVPKVCKTGAGAALLKDPETAEKVVQAVVKAVPVPVTVKVRAGWHRHEFTAPDLAKRFEQCGVKALTLHARFAQQGFDGVANWQLLEQLRSSVSIPLIGNGDIRCADDAVKMLQETGCDGVMIGRSAIGNPWFLRSVRNRLLGLEAPQPPTLTERASVALEHLRMTIDFAKEDFQEELNRPLTRQEIDLCDQRKTASLRGQLPLYFKGFANASKLRAILFSCNGFADVEAAVEDFMNQADVPVFNADEAKEPAVMVQ